MTNDNLSKLLSRIKIDNERFLVECYNSLIISLFEVVVNVLNSDQDLKLRTRNRLRNSSNKNLTSKNIVKDFTNCELSLDEAEKIKKLLEAYLNKSGKRYDYGPCIRYQLLQKQKCRCNLCGTDIDLDNSELDHTIPWVLVGDELGSDNLQLLCKDCNRRKSSSASYNLKMFLIKKDNH